MQNPCGLDVLMGIGWRSELFLALETSIIISQVCWLVVSLLKRMRSATGCCFTSGADGCGIVTTRGWMICDIGARMSVDSHLPDWGSLLIFHACLYTIPFVTVVRQASIDCLSLPIGYGVFYGYYVNYRYILFGPNDIIPLNNIISMPKHYSVFPD